MILVGECGVHVTEIVKKDKNSQCHSSDFYHKVMFLEFLRTLPKTTDTVPILPRTLCGLKLSSKLQAYCAVLCCALPNHQSRSQKKRGSASKATMNSIAVAFISRTRFEIDETRLGYEFFDCGVVPGGISPIPFWTVFSGGANKS